MKEQSIRQLKVGQEIKSVLSEIFMKQDFYNPETFEQIDITISEVQVSADMRNATVYFHPLAGKNKENLESMLNPIASKIKGMMGKKLHLKRIPNLYFKLDDSFSEAQKMNELIKD
jgi:ribosome-binding factor A